MNPQKDPKLLKEHLLASKFIWIFSIDIAVLANT